MCVFGERRALESWSLLQGAAGIKKSTSPHLTAQVLGSSFSSTTGIGCRLLLSARALLLYVCVTRLRFVCRRSEDLGTFPPKTKSGCRWFFGSPTSRCCGIDGFASPDYSRFAFSITLSKKNRKF